jgi:opacity protein-like surface antigen
MLRKLLIPALALAVLPAVAHAQRADNDYGFNQGNWEMTVAGQGANDSSWEGTAFNIQGSLGYFFTDALEVSARQSINFSDLGASTLTGQTTAAADYHFDMGQLQPFAGANVGYIWGSQDLQPNTWTAAPEAGVKYFLNHTTFVEGRVEYDFFFQPGHGAGFSDGQFQYTLALGVKF